MRRPAAPHSRPFLLAGAAALLCGALFGTGCSSSAHRRAEPAPEDETHAVVLAPDRAGRLQHEVFVVKNASVSSLSTVGTRIVWGQLEGPEERRTPALLERDSTTGRVRELAADPVPAMGVAASRSTVTYVRSTSSGTNEVVTIAGPRDTTTVIGRDVATPIAVRGVRVAWAEQTSTQQRVVVRNLTTGTSWIAAALPRCSGEDRCYRIDTVALADDGVVFNRSAIGAQPSQIVRRRFGATNSELYTVPHDPQPDVAQASSGAFFYVLGRGWKRWDFAAREPAATPLRTVRPWLLGYDRGAMLLQTGRACSPRLLVRRPGRRDIVAKPPAEVPPRARSGPAGTPCRLMTAYDWDGRHLLVAWTLTTEETIATHAETAPVAVVTSTPLD
jgi:hypothetical protein